MSNYTYRKVNGADVFQIVHETTDDANGITFTSIVGTVYNEAIAARICAMLANPDKRERKAYPHGYLQLLERDSGLSRATVTRYVRGRRIHRSSQRLLEAVIAEHPPETFDGTDWRATQ